MSEPYDREEAPVLADELDEARENVFDGWPSSEDVSVFSSAVEAGTVEAGTVEAGTVEAGTVEEDAFGAGDVEPAAEPFASPPEPEPGVPQAAAEPEAPQAVEHAPASGEPEHAPGQLAVPPEYTVLEGGPDGARRAVGVVVSRFNGEITSRLLATALEELERVGVAREAITVVPVPGAFELPIAAMALARTRRYACIVALGCVIRGETPHFDYVAGEAASGLQLAALETGIPVSFGVLTVESGEQAEARIEKGAEAVRTALEMADVFAQLRQTAAAAGGQR